MSRDPFSTGWCYHPVLMNLLTLVLDGNTTQYLCLAFCAGWCLPHGTESTLQVITSKGKYLSLNHNYYVDEMVSELHVRQEVMGSNHSHRNVPYFLLTQCKGHFSTGSSPGINTSSLQSRMPSTGCNQRLFSTCAIGTFSSLQSRMPSTGCNQRLFSTCAIGTFSSSVRDLQSTIHYLWCS